MIILQSWGGAGGTSQARTDAGSGSVRPRRMAFLPRAHLGPQEVEARPGRAGGALGSGRSCTLWREAEGGAPLAYVHCSLPLAHTG